MRNNIHNVTPSTPPKKNERGGQRNTQIKGVLQERTVVKSKVGRRRRRGGTGTLRTLSQEVPGGVCALEERECVCSREREREVRREIRRLERGRTNSQRERERARARAVFGTTIHDFARFLFSLLEHRE